MNAIEIKNLNKKYCDFSLTDLNLVLPQGSIMGLVGENGAGKTTTLKLIMNAILRDSGSVSVLGVDNKSSEFQNIKEEIGIVLDEAYFPECITAQNVNSIMRIPIKIGMRTSITPTLSNFHCRRQNSLRIFPGE